MNEFRMPYTPMVEKQRAPMPFCLTYPMQNVYQTEREYEMDRERLKELYPKRMKKVLAYVEDECDKMEYEGSRMYDVYPDKVMLYCAANRIYDEMMPMEESRTGRRERDKDFMDVIQVLLYDEIYRRRGRHRRCCKRWW